MAYTIPTDAAAALVAAGSMRMAPAARAELDDRIGRYGVTAAARNIGGIACALPGPHASHGDKCVAVRGRAIEVFPNYESAARRAVRLARLVTGEGAARPSASGDVAGFRSIAPGEGRPPLEVSHTDGADADVPALQAVLARHVGGDEQAHRLVKSWRSIRPGTRAEIRAQLDAEERASGRPEGAPRATDALDRLAGLEDETGATKPKAKAKAKKKPTPAAVVKARARARAARAAANRARAQLAAQNQQITDLRSQLDQQAQQAQQGAASPEGTVPAASSPEAQQEAAPPGGEAAPGDLAAQLAAMQAQLGPMQIQADEAEADASEAETDGAEMAGLFGPSDASAHAFQDLRAQWAALEKYPGAASLPGWTISRNDWIAFSAAWEAGDDKAPVCAGSCEDGLNARIGDIERLRADLATKDPAWAQQIQAPARLSLEQRHPNATAADRAIVQPAISAVPALDKLTAPNGAPARFLFGDAPKWQYGAALAALLATVGGIGLGVARIYAPRRR